MRFPRLVAVAAAALPALLATMAAAAEPHWPATARLYIISPRNGDVITGPVRVVMGLSGLGVAPAGVDKPNTGHHHILVDAPAPSGDELNAPMPATDNLKHFGGGQTETNLTLPPGKHTIQLILGDQNHIPHNPPLVSEVITITVK
ncbi:MAG: DUF4399 domain-containing protein [Alsobacter sp.]